MCRNRHTFWTFVLKKACHPVHSGGDEAATWTAYVGKMFSAASSYFPSQVSGMMSQDRAFATVHLLTSGQRNVCTLAMWEFDQSEVLIVGLGFETNQLKCILNCCFRIQKLPRLMVATADGQLFIYNMDPMDGGECTLAHKHRWGNRGWGWCKPSKMKGEENLCSLI